MTAPTDPVMILENLSVEFGDKKSPAKVLQDVSLFVRRGERVAVVGESGCGKSLTVLALMGLLPNSARVTSGKLTLDGREVPRSGWGVSRRPAPGFAMIFQQPTASLNPVFTVGDQMLAVARTQADARGKSKADLLALCERTLAQVQLSDPRRILNSYPFQLSGGMRQRILIALALLRRPRILLADEPGTALDVTIQAEILELLDQLVAEEGLALLHITHNLGVARETTDRVYVMYAGNTVERANTRELFRDPQHPYTVGLLESIPRLDGSGTGIGIPGTVPGVRELPAGCRFQTRCPLAEPKCAELHATFPDIVSDTHQVACLHPVTGEQRGNLWR